jgi:hypothetical protein
MDSNVGKGQDDIVDRANQGQLVTGDLSVVLENGPDDPAGRVPALHRLLPCRPAHHEVADDSVVRQATQDEGLDKALCSLRSNSRPGVENTSSCRWRKRLCEAPPDDDAVLHNRSRARKHPPPSLSPLMIERILAIRDEPPANLQRVPGPDTILYILQQDAELQAAGVSPPRSSATVWQLLHQHGRIPHRRRPVHEPVDLPPPLTTWQIDFKDVSTVPCDPKGKRQHVVEALNCVDCGTSLLVATAVRADFTEETTRTRHGQRHGPCWRRGVTRQIHPKPMRNALLNNTPVGQPAGAQGFRGPTAWILSGRILTPR